MRCSVEKIETVYSRSPFVAQIFVYGDSLQMSLVAVVVPNKQTVTQFAIDNNIPVVRCVIFFRCLC